MGNLEALVLLLQPESFSVHLMLLCVGASPPETKKAVGQAPLQKGRDKPQTQQFRATQKRSRKKLEGQVQPFHMHMQVYLAPVSSYSQLEMVKAG